MSFNPVREKNHKNDEILSSQETSFFILEGVKTARKMKMLAREWEFFQRRCRHPAKNLVY